MTVRCGEIRGVGRYRIPLGERTREETNSDGNTMLDLGNPIVRELLKRGFRLAAHAYLRGEDDVAKVTFVAKHRDGSVVQGWSRGGTAADALSDLARRAGLAEAEIGNNCQTIGG